MDKETVNQIHIVPCKAKRLAQPKPAVIGEHHGQMRRCAFGETLEDALNIIA